MNYLGLDVGGTKIAAVVMDEQGREQGRYRCATRKENRQAFMSCIVDFVADIRARTGTPMAIGIALPGSVSPQHGVIRNANIQVINGYRLQDALEQALGQPVVLANDGNCFALSEACDGAGEGFSSVFGMTLGTGCGGGIALERQPFVGASGIAAECGHIALPGYSPEEDGPPTRCYCGRFNCVESLFPQRGYVNAIDCSAESVCRASRFSPARRRENPPLAIRSTAFVNSWRGRWRLLSISSTPA